MVLSFELNQTVEVLPYSVWLVPTLIGRKYQLNKLSLGSTLLFRNLKSNKGSCGLESVWIERLFWRARLGRGLQRGSLGGSAGGPQGGRRGQESVWLERLFYYLSKICRLG